MGDPEPSSSDCLGFIFYWGLSQKGAVIPKLKSEGKRLRVKLKRVNEGEVRETGLPTRNIKAQTKGATQ